MLTSPMFRLGLPTVGAVVLGTMFFQEIIRINQLLPNRATGIKEEEIVDTFDINKELEVRLSTVLRSQIRVTPLCISSHCFSV